jgi:hypothetical protein
MGSYMSLDYRYAVVQVMPTYWANIMSDVIYESGKVTTIHLPCILHPKIHQENSHAFEHKYISSCRLGCVWIHLYVSCCLPIIVHRVYIDALGLARLYTKC